MSKFYFEFNKNEYYGLVVVEEGSYSNALQKSYQIYQSQIAGDSIQEVINEGIPDLIDEKDALTKFIKGCENEDIQDLVNEFNSSKDVALLVDYALA